MKKNEVTHGKHGGGYLIRVIQPCKGGYSIELIEWYSYLHKCNIVSVRSEFLKIVEK